MERGARMAKNSAAKIAANNRYTAKAYDRISFLVPKGQRELIQQHAKDRGESTNAFILRAVMAAIAHDRRGGDTPAEAWAEIEEESSAE